MNKILEKKGNLVSTFIISIGLPFVVQFILSIVLVFVLALYFYTQSSVFATTSSLNTLKSLSNEVNNEIEYLVSRGALISSFSSRFSEDETKQLVRSFVSSKPQTLRVAFYNMEKELVWEVSSTPGKKLPIKQTIRTIPTSIVRQDVYFEEMDVFIHNVEYPITNKDNRRIGVIEYSYDISYLWQIISSFDTKNVFITDKNGAILLSKSKLESSHEMIDKDILLKYTNKYNNLISYDNNGEVISGVASEIKSVDWILIVEELLESKTKTSKIFIYLAIVFVIILVLINSFGIYYFTKKMFKPLYALDSYTKKIAEGEDVVIPYFKNNQIFNNIVEYINQASLSHRLLRKDFNKQLEIKISQLSRSVTEAESMSSLMVNRELKMIELKKENEELKAKLRQLNNNIYNAEGEE